jgi:hypothetical protein
MGALISVGYKPIVEILPFHNDIAKAVSLHTRESVKLSEHVRALIKGRFESLPRPEVYEADQDAFEIVSKAVNLTAQHCLKTYAAAMRDIFECVPVNMGAEAMRKRAERRDPLKQKVYELAKADALKAGKPEYWAEALAVECARKSKAAKKAEPVLDESATQLTIGELTERAFTIGSAGALQVLEGIVKAMAQDKRCSAQAKALADLTAQLRVVWKLHEAAPSADPANKPKLGDATHALADLATGTNG